MVKIFDIVGNGRLCTMEDLKGWVWGGVKDNISHVFFILGENENRRILTANGRGCGTTYLGEISEDLYDGDTHEQVAENKCVYKGARMGNYFWGDKISVGRSEKKTP